MSNKALREKLNWSLAEFDFPVRVKDILEREGIVTARTLIAFTEEELLAIPGIGRTETASILVGLRKCALWLDMSWEIDGVELPDSIRVRLSAREQSFLQTLFEEPRDFVTRAVYADWLEERGQADRAEFLRLWDAVIGEESLRDARHRRLGELRSRFEEDWLRIVEPVTLLGEVSVRSEGVLRRLRVGTVGQLCETSAGEILASRGFAETPLRELGGLLATVGLSLQEWSGW